MNTFLIYIVLIFWAVTTIYPIFWVISNSFKDKKMIMSDAFSLPLGKLFTTANYTDAFSKMNILNAYKNRMCGSSGDPAGWHGVFRSGKIQL